MANLISWINIAVVFGSIVLFGAVGETLTEKAGNLNLGTPGIMCMGGAFGFVGAYPEIFLVEMPEPLLHPFYCNNHVCIFIQ